MKCALITDQHFMVRDSSEYFLNKYELFYKNIFFPTLKKHGIKTIICFGDIWEDRKKFDINGFNRSLEMYFDVAEENGIKIITILGNHDVYLKNTNEINSLEFLTKRYKNLEFVYETGIIDLNGFKLALCSWINKENYERCMNFINTCDASYLGGHFEINNFEMVRGHNCEGGLDPILFKRFKEVWSGHFHIRSKKDNIRYLGNPHQTNKGDIGYERGFHIFDTESEELTFIENTYNVYESIRYNDDFDIDSFIDNDKELYDDKIVTIYVKSFVNTNMSKLNILINTLYKTFNVHDVIIEETESIKNILSNFNKHIEENNKEPNENEVEENVFASLNTNSDTDTTTNLDILHNYVDIIIDEDDNTNTNKNIKNILVDLYSEAINIVEE